MSFKKLFLPLGIVLAVIFSLLLPDAGTWIKENSGVYLFVIILFFLNGWSFTTGEVKSPVRLLPFLALSAILSLIIAPLAASILSETLQLSLPIDTGLIVMLAMPTTLSSAIVITGVIGGNRTWAMFLTMGLNLLAIVCVPFIVPFFIELEGGVRIDALALLYKMLLLVLLPFLCGAGFKRLLSPIKVICSYLPSVCVMVTVYAAFSASHEYIINFDYSKLPLILAAIVILHGFLLSCGILSGKLLHLHTGEKIAFILCTAHKTLPMAISIITAAGIDDGLVLIPCMLYYFIQLTLDTVILHHLYPSEK